jgi:hypothetical protein
VRHGVRRAAVFLANVHVLRLPGAPREDAGAFGGAFAFNAFAGFNSKCRYAVRVAIIVKPRQPVIFSDCETRGAEKRLGRDQIPSMPQDFFLRFQQLLNPHMKANWRPLTEK